MVSLFLLLGCNLSYIVDLFAALHELASASARTLLKLASSVRALLKPYGDTLKGLHIPITVKFKLFQSCKKSLINVACSGPLYKNIPALGPYVKTRFKPLYSNNMALMFG